MARLILHGYQGGCKVTLEVESVAAAVREMWLTMDVPGDGIADWAIDRLCGQDGTLIMDAESLSDAALELDDVEEPKP